LEFLPCFPFPATPSTYINYSNISTFFNKTSVAIFFWFQLLGAMFLAAVLSLISAAPAPQPTFGEFMLWFVHLPINN
jgi:hypothetical protein